MHTVSVSVHVKPMNAKQVTGVKMDCACQFVQVSNVPMEKSVRRVDAWMCAKALVAPKDNCVLKESVDLIRVKISLVHRENVVALKGARSIHVLR